MNNGARPTIWFRYVDDTFTLFYLMLHGQQEEPTHLSKRVGDIVPGVVVYL